MRFDCCFRSVGCIAGVLRSSASQKESVQRDCARVQRRGLGDFLLDILLRSSPRSSCLLRLLQCQSFLLHRIAPLPPRLSLLPPPPTPPLRLLSDAPTSAASRLASSSAQSVKRAFRRLALLFPWPNERRGRREERAEKRVGQGLWARRRPARESEGADSALVRADSALRASSSAARSASLRIVRPATACASSRRGLSRAGRG